MSSSFPNNQTNFAHSSSSIRLRRVSSRPLEVQSATFISPIERWADRNYAPQELGYVFKQNTQSSEIMAPMHGYEAEDVQISITRERCIILLSLARSRYPSQQEYYCEVPLPPDANLNGAYVVFTNDFMSIRLGKKQTVVSQVVSLGRGVKNKLTPLLACKWNYGRLND